MRREGERSVKVTSGPITNSPAETWSAIDVALKAGLRGLLGGYEKGIAGE